MATAHDRIIVLIRDLVEATKQWQGRGQPIEKRKDDLRSELRDAMIAAKLTQVADKQSGYRAVLAAQDADVYVIEKLRPFIPKGVKFVKTVKKVMAAVIKGLEKEGVFTRQQLLDAGALVREPKTAPFVTLEQLEHTARPRPATTRRGKSVKAGSAAR